MIRKLDRYIFADAVVVSFVTMFFLISFLMTFDLIKIIDVLFVQDKDIFFVLKFIFRLIWVVVPLAVPIALVVGVIYAINKLCKSSEFTILKASGISNFRIYLPIFIFTSIMSVWMYYLQKETIPSSKRAFRQEKYYLIETAFKSRLKEKEFFTEISNLVLFVDKYDKENSVLENIFFKMTEDKNQKIVSAKKAIVKFKEGLGATKDSMSMDFFDGVILDFIKEENIIKKVKFSRYNYEPEPTGSRKVNVDNAGTLSSEDLLKLRTKYRKNKKVKEARSLSLEYYQRILTPLMCLFLPLIGFFLGMSEMRSHKTNIVLRSFGFLAVYYISFFGLSGVAKSGQIPELAAFYIPLSVMILMSLYLNFKSKWLN